MGELTLHIIQWVLGFAVLGMTAGYGQRWALEVSGRWMAFSVMLLPGIVLATIVVVLPFWSGPLNLLNNAIPGAGLIDWVGIIVLTGALAGWLTAITALGIGFWDRLFSQGFLDAVRGMVRLLPPMIVFGVIVVMLPSFSRTLDPSRRYFMVNDEGASSHVIMVCVLALVGLNASGIARSLACRGLERLLTVLITVLPTIVFGITTFSLSRIAFDGVESSSDLAFIVRGFESHQSLSPFQRLGAWLSVYVFVVLSLALGGAIGLRYGPKPWGKVKPISPWHWSQFQLLRRFSGKDEPVRARVKVRLDDYATSGGALPPVQVEAARAAALAKQLAKEKAKEQAQQKPAEKGDYTDVAFVDCADEASGDKSTRTGRQRVKVRFEELASMIETVRSMTESQGASAGGSESDTELKSESKSESNAHLDPDTSSDQPSQGRSRRLSSRQSPGKRERVKIRLSDLSVKRASHSDSREGAEPASQSPDTIDTTHTTHTTEQPAVERPARKRVKVRFSELARDYITEENITRHHEYESFDKPVDTQADTQADSQADPADDSAGSSSRASDARGGKSAAFAHIGAAYAITAPRMGMLLLSALLFVLFIWWQLLYPFDFEHNPRPRWLVDESLPKLSTLANVALFMPLGVLIAWAMRLRIRSWLAIAAITVVTGAMVSVIGETIQIWLPNRFSSIMDLAANGLGSFLGFVIVVFFWKQLNARWRRAVIWLDPRPKMRRAFWWFAALVLVRAYPMDLSPDTFYTKRQTYYESRTLIQPFARVINYLRAESAEDGWGASDAIRAAAIHEVVGVMTTFLIFVPVAFVLAAAMREAQRLTPRKPGPWVRTLVMGMTLVLATEVFQWIVKSRVLDTTEPLVGMMAVPLGVMAESLWDRVRHLDPRHAAVRG